jgi:hypothetical protein
MNFLPRLTLNCSPPNLHLVSSWDYSPEPVFLSEMGLRPSYLCIMHSLPPCPACWLRWGLTNFAWTGLSHPSDLHLLSSWDYRPEPSNLAPIFKLGCYC